jgi:PKD repeat protein
MDMKIRAHRLVALIGLAVIAAGVSACSLDKQEMPPLSGPSELSLSLTMTASPDQIPRDGSSQSIVTITARDIAGRPLVGQRITLALQANAPTGTALSQSEVTTGSNGTATFTVTAPLPGSTGNIIVSATPVGTNAGNEVARVVQIVATPQNTSVPAAAFSFTPASPEVGQTVTFNASSTRDEGVSCTSCTFFWNFGGDGTATGMIVTHAFSSGGSFVVTLTATDTGGSSNSTQQTVTVSVASIPTGLNVTSVPVRPIVKQAATFTASATAATNHRIVSYEFVWGDGEKTTSSSAVVQHTYSTVQKFNLTLTVRDDLNQSATRDFVIDVDSGLTASFTNTPASPTAGQSVTFDASASSSSVASTITKFEWDFDGDGTFEKDNGTNPIVQNTFGTAGTYRVTLRITDSRGVTQTVTRTITVS